MVEISKSYNKFSNREKPVSHLLMYPDGVKRILTMKQYEWDWIEFVERHNVPFYELLVAAIELSEEHPRLGYQADILENTRFMLLTAMRGIHEEEHPVSNH